MKKRLLTFILAASLVISGCSSSDDGNTSSGQADSSAGSSANVVSGTSISFDASEIFSDRDYEVGYDESESAVIELNGDSATSDSDAVAISDGTITITDEGTYIIRGTLDDGMIIVDTDDTNKVQLVLSDVSITSEDCAPIYIKQADKVFITLADGTTNTLSGGDTFTAIDDNNIDAVIFSKEDLTFNGSGTLIISSPAGHGIVSKDSLKFTGGTYEITCASHAISGKDEVSITDADFTIVSGKDGIHAENDDDTSLGYVYIAGGTFDISAEGDALSASYCMQIDDGAFNIIAGGGSENGSSATSDSWGDFRGGGGMRGGMQYQSYQTDTDTTDDSTSMKGIKASASIVINGGTFVIDSADDAVHSNASLTINGGNFDIATGDDGFHADETLTITSGTILITESYEGIEGLYIYIYGGDITLTADDDGLNAAGGTDSSGNTGGRDGMFGGGMTSSNGSITISGGALDITASGDGIDANGSIEITDGYIVVSGPTEGDTATLDYDSTAVITGGTFIGTGASSMAQTFSSSEQGVISVSTGTQAAGTEIVLADSEGNTIISYTPELDFAVIIMSSPDIISGETYILTVGTTSAEFTAS